MQRVIGEPADPRLAEWAHVLFDQAVLTLGVRVEEPATFVAGLNDLPVNLTEQTDDVVRDPSHVIPSDIRAIRAGRRAPASDNSKGMLP